MNLKRSSLPLIIGLTVPGSCLAEAPAHHLAERQQKANAEVARLLPMMTLEE